MREIAKIEPFIYKTVVRFSDTDLYGIAHHSNYFRWMEEARMEFLEEILQLSLKDCEKEQIQFPVIYLDGKFIKSVTAREIVIVKMLMDYDSSSKIVFHYNIQNAEDKLIFHGKTEHVLTENKRMQLNMPESLDKIIKDKVKEYKDKYIVLY